MTQCQSTISEFTPEVIKMIKEALRAHDYKMLEYISSGGFSVIYQVYSEKYNKHFAAKIVNTQSSRHRNSEASIENEISALSILYHPNIIKLYNSFQHNRFHFLIIELCNAISLSELIKQNELLNAKETKILTILNQLTSAVLFCHEHGYAHRDIKPFNILFDEYGRLKLADFGFARHFTPNEKSNEYIGSPRYMSPEIFKKEPFNPFAADIWALGVTFYEICGGVPDWPESKQLLATSIQTGGLLVKATKFHKIDRLVGMMTEMNPQSRPNIVSVSKLLKQIYPALPSSNSFHQLVPTTAKAPSVPKLFSLKEQTPPRISHHSSASRINLLAKSRLALQKSCFEGGKNILETQQS